jgi:hypothetical protein
MLSPIPEASSQIGSPPGPTIVQTPHRCKLMFKVPSGGLGSAGSNGHKRTKRRPSFIASPPAPEIDIVTNTPPDARPSSGHSSRDH